MGKELEIIEVMDRYMGVHFIIFSPSVIFEFF